MHAAAATPEHRRLTVLAAVAATLGVLTLPPVALSLSPWQPAREAGSGALSDLAERALFELPHAYQLGPRVIVPWDTDESISFSGAIRAERIVGRPVSLGARGLVRYDLASASDRAPAWTDTISTSDRIYADLGNLYFSCVLWPGEQDCEAAVLVRDEDSWHFFRSGLGSAGFLDPGSGMETFAFDVLGGPDEQVVLGGLGRTDVADVTLRLVDGSRVSAQVSSDQAVAGATVWWATVGTRVSSIRVATLDGGVITDEG